MAGNYEIIDNVRALSQNEVNKLSATQLKKALMTIITADKPDEPSNNDLLAELRIIQANVQEINKVKEEVKCLSDKLNSAFQIIHQQQLYLEAQDNRERRCNLVITGLSEVADNVGADDAEKLRTFLTKAKCPSTIDPAGYTVRRLGQPNPDRGGRPLHVICETQKQRDAIIATAKELKNAGTSFSRVYIKKDQHPVVRKEIGRLRKKAKDEAGLAENTGTIVVYDPKNRIVTRDGVIIDCFTPKFF